MLRTVTYVEPIRPQDTQDVKTCELNIYVYFTYTAHRRNMTNLDTGGIHPAPAHASTQL